MKRPWIAFKKEQSDSDSDNWDSQRPRKRTRQPENFEPPAPQSRLKPTARKKKKKFGKVASNARPSRSCMLDLCHVILLIVCLAIPQRNHGVVGVQMVPESGEQQLELKLITF